jgi:glycerate 2-kinase
MTDDLHNILRTGFDAALTAGDPFEITRKACADMAAAPTAIIALGKAAGAMADAARGAGFDAPGIVVTNDENHRQIAGFACFATAHPVPDQRGIDAGLAVEALVSSLGADDHLLLLISGGGSALLPAPAAPFGLAQKQALNDALLASGLDIHAMNIVRRLFSRLKGGRLARLTAPARITQFLLSDVPGDVLESIASGPAVADPVPLSTAIDLIKQHRLDRLDFVPSFLASLEAGAVAAPVRPDDPVWRHVDTHILASNAHCQAAAQAAVQSERPDLHMLTAPALAGEAANMARQLADLVRDGASRHPGRLVGLVAGGETTVTLDPASAGLGGRSQELALAFASALHAAGGLADWAILAGGTDGRDGPTDAAGGLLSARQPFDAGAAANALAGHNSYHYLKAHDQLLHVGATGTNLADLVLIVARH